MTAIGADARLNENTGEYEYIGLGIQRSAMRETGFFLQDSWRVQAEPDDQRWAALYAAVPVHCEQQQLLHADRRGCLRPVGCEFGTGYLQPVPAGRDARQDDPAVLQPRKGKHAYNTDWNNLAPNVGMAWTPAPRGGFLGTLMSEEFVFRAGWARAYSRNGMGDFTGAVQREPWCRRQRRPERRPAATSSPRRPADRRRCCSATMRIWSPGAFPATPVYPMTDVVDRQTSACSIRTSRSRTRTPGAPAFSASCQHQHGARNPLRRHAVARRCGRRETSTRSTSSRTDSSTSSGRRRETCRPTSPAGRGATRSRFTGAPGTAPLPILLAHFNSQPLANARQHRALHRHQLDQLRRSSRFWRSATRTRTDSPTVDHGHASDTALIGNATFRNAAIAAGVPRNFFVANPDLIGGAFITLNSHKTRLPLDAGRTAPPSGAGAAVPDQLRVRQGDADRVPHAIGATCSGSATSATPGDIDPPVQGERRLRSAVRPGPPVHGRRRSV